jgi:hypothetical protein
MAALPAGGVFGLAVAAVWPVAGVGLPPGEAAVGCGVGIVPPLGGGVVGAAVKVCALGAWVVGMAALPVGGVLGLPAVWPVAGAGLLPGEVAVGCGVGAEPPVAEAAVKV